MRRCQHCCTASCHNLLKLNTLLQVIISYLFQFHPLRPKLEILFLFTNYHGFLLQFLYSPHLSACQCIDIVRKILSLITFENQRNNLRTSFFHVNFSSFTRDSISCRVERRDPYTVNITVVQVLQVQ